MSIFITKQFTCPNCNKIHDYDHYASVNADRRPDLREEIIADTFERITCEDCSLDFRPEPSLNYLDFKNGLWIMALPNVEIARWDVEEARASDLFNSAYGTGAPASAREIGDTLTARVTFGWAAFREKLVLREAGLDDLMIEKAKIAVLYNRPGNPVAPGVELRLLNAREKAFRMGWINTSTGKIEQQFDILRALYDSTADGGDWAEIDGKIGSGLFVDMQKMFIEPEKKGENTAE